MVLIIKNQWTKNCQSFNLVAVGVRGGMEGGRKCKIFYLYLFGWGLCILYNFEN